MRRPLIMVWLDTLTSSGRLCQYAVLHRLNLVLIVRLLMSLKCCRCRLSKNMAAPYLVNRGPQAHRNYLSSSLHISKKIVFSSTGVVFLS